MARSAMSFSVRTAGPGDLEPLLPLVRELWKHEALHWHETGTPAALARLLGDASLGRVWIGELDGAAIGYLVLCFGFSLEYLGRDAFVDELYVEPALQGRGLGLQLLAVAEAVCAELGIAALHLEVDHVNPRAKALYARAGFREHARHLMTKALR
ncbi:MAG: GNAT family N-acetyltransferase [bacterium]